MTLERLRTGVAALALGGLLTTGCGGDPPPEPPAPGAGGWHVVELSGVKGASGVAVLEDLLVIVAGGDERRVFLQPRADLKPGRRAEPRPLRFEVNRDVHLEGMSLGGREEDFVGQGYRLGTLWDQPVDFQGVAARHIPSRGVGPAVDALYVLERTFGIVYRGRLLRDAAGAPEAAPLDSAFVVPERDRTGSVRSDWRDLSAGLSGVLSVPHEQSSEDLYLTEREGTEPASFRVIRLDRFGQWQGKFTVNLPAGAPPEIGDLSWSDERFVFVRGEGRGALVACQDPGDYASVTAGAPVPAPEIAGAGPWRGLAHAPDGTAYLVSAGSPSRLAWRPRKPAARHPRRDAQAADNYRAHAPSPACPAA
jgi:hypothetical protein